MDLPAGEDFIRNNTDPASSIRANERQRISRDLHNATSQLITALQLQVGQLRRQDLPTAMPIIAGMDQVIREIRLSIRQIETEQSRDGHDRCEADLATAKIFYALAHRPPADRVIDPAEAP